MREGVCFCAGLPGIGHADWLLIGQQMDIVSFAFSMVRFEWYTQLIASELPHGTAPRLGKAEFFVQEPLCWGAGAAFGQAQPMFSPGSLALCRG